MRLCVRCITFLGVIILILFFYSYFPQWIRAQSKPRVAAKPPNRASWAGQPKFKRDEILVRFRPGVPQERANALHAAVRARPVKSWPSVRGLQLVQLPAGMTIKDAILAYRKNPDVLYAEPDYVVHALITPNDPHFPSLWGLQNIGQMDGAPGADIHAAQAWGITTGSSNVVVAVIDTGMDYTHEDLSANAWRSPFSFSETVNGTTINCPAGSFGFNAVNNSCDPMDDNGHGTHVSGTIGAVGNNGVGVAGVNWTVGLLPCKFLDATGSGTVDAAVTCFDFIKAMKDQGVNVVATNNSWGGDGFSQALSDAIQAQQQDGILCVASAGNDSADNDLGGFYPADLFLPNVISVAATTRFDWLADFSNLGLHSVALGAPGQDILSSVPNNSYAWLSGTSMAAPHVTGVAALLAAQDPTRDWRSIKNLILAGGDTLSSLAQTITGKRLNAYGSLTCSNSAVARRLQPTLDTVTGAIGAPLILAAININCALPVGPVTVTVSPGGQVITLQDNGIAPDQAAGDGIYTGLWVPAGVGNYQLAFSTGDTVQVTVLTNYSVGETSDSYQTIPGTNLNLGDDDVATLSLPFSVKYGGAQFSQVYVSSNGTISFTNAFDDFLNFAIPVNAIENLNAQNPPPPIPLQPVVTLIAPYWMDLYPVKGTNQNVFWGVAGSAPNRQLVIEWRNVPSFSCRADASANVTFEVVFSESRSDVVFNYANTTFGGACSNQDDGQDATIGMQVNQNVGTQWGEDQPAIASGMSLLWTLASSNQSQNPVPNVTSITPSSIPAGSSDTWVTVTGTGFVPATQVIAYPVPNLVTKYISSTQVQVLLTASELAYPVFGNGMQLNAVNPPPGGGYSQAFYLSITPQSAVINSLSPTSVPAGSFGFNLTINGSGFVPGATTVIFGGSQQQASSVTSTQIIFPVTGAQVQTAGTVSVQVQTGPNTFSNTVPFTITAASAPATLQAPLSSSPPAAGGQNLAKPKYTPEPLPGRFLGWKVMSMMGPQYAAKYKRQLARLALPAPGKHGSAAASMNPAASITTGTPPPLASFNFRPTLPAGFIPTAVVSGDFNVDGNLDWAITNGGDNTIWIYPGKGDGTATLPTVIHLQGFSPVALATADMNGDGKLDLVVAEADSLAVAVLLGNGDGTFGPELTFTVPGIPESLAVADFNGDGKLDVVVGLAGGAGTGQLAFLPGDGTGKLGRPVTHYGQINDYLFLTFAVAAADLNGDGLPDIVALDYSITIDGIIVQDQMGNAGARVYLNQGNGTFKMAQQFFHDSSVDQGPGLGQAVTAVALGDLNADGCTDAVTLDTMGSATLFPGLCDGSFDTANTRIFGAGIVAGAAALADMNGDGKLDLVSSAIPFASDPLYASSPGSSVSVQFGDGTGNFGSPTLYRGEPAMVSLALADLKKNGRPEIITANQQTDTTSVYQNDGAGGLGDPKGGYAGYLTAGQMHAVGNAPLSSFAVLDLNGDGLPDLAVPEMGTQYPFPIQMTVMLNNGSGGFAAPVRTPILDVNNDVEDFFFGNFRNTGKQDLLFFSFYLPTQGFGPSFGFAAGNGDGTFQKPAMTKLPSGIAPVRFAVGDFNNDGKLDFLVTSYASVFPGTGTVASIIPFLGNGDGTFTEGTPISFNSTTTQDPFLSAAIVTDVNGDGKADLLALGSQVLSSSEQDAIYEFLGNGDGTFQTPRLLFNNVGPFGVTDLNKDGHPDIVAAVDQGLGAAVFGHIWVYTVFLGNGNGIFSPGQTYGPYPNPYAAGYLYPPADHPMGPSQPVVGDFNGDGIPDLAIYQTAGSNVFNAVGYAGSPLDTTVTVLAGNGDGTFTAPNLSQGLGDLVVPQTPTDLNGDGHTDLMEMNAYTSAYTYLTATSGPSFSASLVSDPVIGANGILRIILFNSSTNSITLQLSASDPSITVPASVTIPSGTASQDVAFQINSGFDSSHVFAITAQSGTEVHIAYGTQAAPGQDAGFAAIFQNTTTPVIVAGQTTPDFSLLVGSISGYTTQISVSCQGLPAGASCQIAPNPVGLPAGGQVAVSLAVATQSSLPQASYPFKVNLTDGVVSVTLSAAFNIGDFTMSLSPAAQTLGANDFAAFTLNIGSIDGYSQPIQITCGGLPSGTTCPFTGAVFPGSNSFQIHTRNANPGTYTFTLTGASSGITRTASAQLTVTAGTFTGSVSPSSATINVGSSQNFTVQINSNAGFQGQVNLACSPQAVWLTCQVNPSQVSLSSGGTANATLTVSATANPTYAPPQGRPTQRLRNISKPLIPVILLLLVFFGTWVCFGSSSLTSLSPGKLTLGHRLIFGILVFLALAATSCGAGSTSGGSRGGVTESVTVQGTIGTTTVTIGSVNVTVP